MISYEGLLSKLNAKGLTKTALTDELGISSRTVAKIGRGEKIAAHVLAKIAAYLSCTPEELYRSISDNLLLQTLRDEKSIRMPGGLYHELQVRMTYNSNHIEGSRLTHDQTRYIFETNTIGASDGTVKVDDVVETANHFKCIDMVIDNANYAPSEAFIKQLHAVLKSGTSDSRLDWFAVGNYKKLPNEVGGMDTAAPENVGLEMKKLLAEYNAITRKTFDDLLDFHYRFERIHPFQDGNGRVGRLLLFKECLRNNIVPFIIEDDIKMFYYRGLKEWQNERGYLRDTCLAAQDRFKKYLDYFRVPYDK